MSGHRGRTVGLAALVALAAIAVVANSSSIATTGRSAVVRAGTIRVPAIWTATPATPATLDQAARTVFTSDQTGFQPLRRPDSVGIAPTLAAQVSATETGSPMPAGFIGLSIEYTALRAYIGRDPSAINPVFVALVRALDPDQSPVLRIGGDSTDQTWWPIPGILPPAGVTYSLTNDWLQVARSMAATLNARLIMGINLSADSPAIAAAEARALIGGIGRHYIDALEIGNEPDVYTQYGWYRDRLGHVVFARPAGYDIDSYISDFSRWRTAMPKVALAGPAFAQATWMADLPTFLASEPGVRLVTFHRYPLRGCEPNPTLSDYPSIPNLLSDASSAGMAEQVAPFAAAAHQAGIPFRLDELNSASCRGKLGLSNTFSSAIWVVDTLFNLAAAGVDGVNIHTLPGAPYEPFAFSQTGGAWTASVRPVYYGLLMFAQAFPPGAQLLSVSAPTGPVKVWATESPNGQIHIVLINKDPTRAVYIHLTLPGSQTPVTSDALTAPSLASTSGVSFGGETFGSSTSTGVLPSNPHPTTIAPALGAYTVSLPAGSAVLLTR